MANCKKLLGGSFFAEFFRRILWLSATNVATTGFLFLIAGDSIADPYLGRFRLPPPQTSTPYDGLRGEVWATARNCIDRATSATVDKWDIKNTNCYVPKFAFDAGQKDYQHRLILYWDGGKQQILLVPFDYISGVEANQFYPTNVLLPDYWSLAIEGLDKLLKKNPFNAPSGGGYGIAMNSANFRTRDQLHLHICTVEKDIIDKIKASKPTDDFTNPPMRFKTGGHQWWVRKFSLSDNVWAKTFLNSKFAAKTEDKANVSIAVIEDTAGNYWLLYNQMGNPGGETGAGGETLLQDKCNGAKEPK
jgi:CDP-diacylglycerol pyrophosphatase